MICQRFDAATVHDVGVGGGSVTAAGGSVTAEPGFGVVGAGVVGTVVVGDTDESFVCP